MSYKEDYERFQEENILLQDKAKRYQDAAYNLSKDLPPYEIKGDTFYILTVSDNHGNTEALLRKLSEVKDVDNLFIYFGGDQEDTAEKNSKTSQFSAKRMQLEVDSLIYAIKKSGIDTNKIHLMLSGNHTDRLFDNCGLEVDKLVAKNFNIEERYARSMAIVNYDLVDFKDKATDTKLSVLMGHGEGKSGNPGKEVDQRLNKNFMNGARIMINGDSHKIVAGNSKETMYNDGKKGAYVSETSYFNFGTDKPEEDYLLEKWIPLRAVHDGELIRVHAKVNEDTKQLVYHVDTTNVRNLINNEQKKYLEDLETKLNSLESIVKNLKSRSEIDKAYTGFLDSLDIVKPEAKSSRYPDSIKLATWSRILQGNTELNNDEKVDQAVKQLAKVDNCYIILNGDNVLYKKADFWKRMKFSENSFAYLRMLAEKLEPVKDKIIAFNYGKHETKIMQYHGDELADYAMKELQIDRDLAYEPISASEEKAQRTMIQDALIRQYNEKNLQEAVDKYVDDGRYDKKGNNIYETSLTNLIKYTEAHLNEDKDITEIVNRCKLEDGSYNVKRLNSGDIEHLVANKLRCEGKLLDITKPKDKKKANSLFPLEDIKVRKPNKNLIGNILCKLWDISPKKIAINSDLAADNYNTLKVTTPNGETRRINIVSSYSKADVTRGKISFELSQNHRGADIYITNGPEFFERTRDANIDETGRHIKDVINISGGRFDRDEALKLYEVKYEESRRTRIMSGMFSDTNDLITTVSTMDYEEANENYDKKVFSDSVKKKVMKSYANAVEDFKNRTTDAEKNAEERLLKKVSKVNVEQKEN